MEFHYKDRVRVISGFYKGVTGKVTNYTKSKKKYTVHFDFIQEKDFSEQELELIQDVKK